MTFLRTAGLYAWVVWYLTQFNACQRHFHGSVIIVSVGQFMMCFVSLGSKIVLYIYIYSYITDLSDFFSWMYSSHHGSQLTNLVLEVAPEIELEAESVALRALTFPHNANHMVKTWKWGLWLCQYDGFPQKDVKSNQGCNNEELRRNSCARRPHLFLAHVELALQTQRVQFFLACLPLSIYVVS